MTGDGCKRRTARRRARSARHGTARPCDVQHDRRGSPAKRGATGAFRRGNTGPDARDPLGTSLAPPAFVRTHILIASPLVLVALVPLGCQSDGSASCGLGQTRVEVLDPHSGEGTGNFVCIDPPIPGTTSSTSAPDASTSPPPGPLTPQDASAPVEGGPPEQDAGALDASPLDARTSDIDAAVPTDTGAHDCAQLEPPASSVVIISKPAPPPAFTEATAPDGSYLLVQGSWYGASPLRTSSARLQISGAKLVLGAQSTDTGGASAKESFTFVLTGDALTLVCRTDSGPLTRWLYPMAPGASESAAVSWDAGNNVLTLRVGSSADLVFQPL